MINLPVRKYLQQALHMPFSSQETDVTTAFELFEACYEPQETASLFPSLTAKGYSNQKISQIIRKMVQAGMLVKVEVEESRNPMYQANPIFVKTVYKLQNTFDSSEEVSKRCKESSKIDDIPYGVEKLTSEKNKLVQYMKHIVRIETDIYALQRRYDSLVLAWNEAVVNSAADCTNLEETADKIKADLLRTIGDLRDKINTRPSPNSQSVSLELPDAPVIPRFEGVKPTEPTYQTPSLFNKKKVNEENRELKRQYEDALSQYHQLYQSYLTKEAQYQRDLESYNAKIEEIKAEEKRQNEEAYKAAVESYEEEIIEWQSELAKKEEELAVFDENRPKEIEKQLANSESYIKQIRIEQEIEYIVYLMEKCYASQAKLYSYGIIYGKYRTYVAVSSFLDYYLSGRVSSLEGPDGAYNLYEQESRADVVIGKLDVIIDSLEDIKENQYYIYNELQTANSNLALINTQLLFNNVVQAAQLEKLDSIVNNMEEIAYNTEKIARNTEETARNAEEIACNTEVAAFYSKKNAELTDALGFMVALS